MLLSFDMFLTGKNIEKKNEDEGNKITRNKIVQ